MALVTLKGGGTLRGSAGGVTAQGGRNGQVLRARTRPRVPQTGLQRGAQSQLMRANNLWANGLTQTERAMWNQYAVINPTISLALRTRAMTGQGWFALYQIYNGYGAPNGMPTLSPLFGSLKPPAPTHIPDSLVWTGIPGAQFQWTGQSTYGMSGAEYYWLYISLATKPGIIPKASDMRFSHAQPLERFAAPFTLEPYGEEDLPGQQRASGSYVMMTFTITGMMQICSEDVMLFQIP